MKQLICAFFEEDENAKRNISVAYCKNKPSERVSSFTLDYFWILMTTSKYFKLLIASERRWTVLWAHCHLIFVNSGIVVSFILILLRLVLDCFQAWEYNCSFSYHCTVDLLLLLCMILSCCSLFVFHFAQSIKKYNECLHIRSNSLIFHFVE